MKEIIARLVYRLDEETAWISSRKQAVVCVPQEVHTPYLMAVRSKAHALGVRILREKRAGLPCVLDAEAKADGLFLGRDEDVDNLWHDGMSCCAEAVFMAMIVAGWDLRSCRTLIVGRGHSVKGLAERLVFNDATVTIAMNCLSIAPQLCQKASQAERPKAVLTSAGRLEIHTEMLSSARKT